MKKMWDIVLFLVALSSIQAGQQEQNEDQKKGFMVVYTGEDKEKQFFSEEISDHSDEGSGGLIFTLSRYSSDSCNTFDNEGDSVWESNPSSVISVRSTPLIFFKEVDDALHTVEKQEEQESETFTIIHKGAQEMITPITCHKKKINNSFCNASCCKCMSVWALAPMVFGQCVGNGIHTLYKTMVMGCLSKEEDNDDARKKT